MDEQKDRLLSDEEIRAIQEDFRLTSLGGTPLYAKESMGRAIAKAQAEKLVRYLAGEAISIDPILGVRIPYQVWQVLKKETSNE